MTQPEPLIAKCDLNKFVIRHEERIDRLEDQLATLIRAAQFLLSLADGETDFQNRSLVRLRSEICVLGSAEGDFTAQNAAQPDYTSNEFQKRVQK